MDQVITKREKYHLFQRNDEICRYGIYGLSREYFKEDESVSRPAQNREITLYLPEVHIRVMQAVITSRCNLKCTYCSFMANSPAFPEVEMSRDEVVSICTQFNSEIGEGGLLLITGGEPELHREAVDYLVENTVGKIIIFTNGTLVDAARLRYFRDQNVGVLFSLDGDLFAQDAVRRGKKGSFSKVAQALKAACALGLDYGISAVVGDHNIERLPQLVEYIYDEFHPTSLGLNLPHRHGDTSWMRIEEYTDALIEIYPYAKKVGLFIDQFNRRLAPLIDQQFRFRDCSAQGEKKVVWPGGKITSCVNEAGLKHFDVDWTNRIPLLNEQCRDCYAIGICGGGCIFDGEAIYGCSQFDKRNCHLTQRLLDHFIWDIRDELGEHAIDREMLKEKYGPLLHRSEGTYLSVGHETI